MTLFNDMALAVRIAARDMRGGARALWLLVAGVFIGVAAVALVGTTSQSIADGARRGALETVGGDLSLRLFHRPPNETELATIRREGTVSISAELRPMAHAVRNDQVDGASALVELKGVDQAYPLFGGVEIVPKLNLHQALRERDGVYGAVADSALFDALGLAPGDRIQIGDAQYQLRGRITVEPDRAFRAFTLGPRIMVSSESLPTTGVADDGATVYYYTRVKLPSPSNSRAEANAAIARIDRAVPQSGWRMVNAHDGVPGLERTLAMAHSLLLFIGLGVMLVGGAGIVGTVNAHIAEKIKIIAILKSIGAPPHVITMAIGFEIIAAASVGALIGVGLGAFGPTLAASALADQLPFALESTPNLKPLLAAGLFGVLVALLFAWLPLMGVRDVKSHMLLSVGFTQTRKKLGVKGWIGAGVIFSMLVALVYWVSPMPMLTAGFLMVALVLTALYFFLGAGFVRLAKVLVKGQGVNVRLILSNLYRTGTPTGSVVMALGLTLTLLVALNGIGTAAHRHVQGTLPHSAPDLVAFSLKPEVATRLEAALAESAIVESQRFLPFLHARVQAIGGIAVRDLKIPASLNWVIRGDRGVSFAAILPNGTRWNNTQSERPGFSVEESVAKKLGLGLGDMITLNVSGYVRSGAILKFHNVDWNGLNLDFPIMATPGTFTGIPYTVAASLKATRGEQKSLEVLIKERFPDVPLIRVADVLSSLAKALDAVVAGLETAGLAFGLAALLVLAGSVLQGVRERIDEAVLFKVLGACRRQLLVLLMVEFLGLSMLVALVAVPLGLGIAHGVARTASLSSVDVSLSGGIMLAVVTIFVTLIVGFTATLGVYTTKPARALRNRQI